MDAVGFCNRFKRFPDVGQYLHVNIISAVRSKLSIGEVPDPLGRDPHLSRTLPSTGHVTLGGTLGIAKITRPCHAVTLGSRL